jgi:hypothetical protein
MGTKGYLNIAKSGMKAASAKRTQAVAKARTRKKPKTTSKPRKPQIEVTIEDGLEESQSQDG